MKWKMPIWLGGLAAGCAAPPPQLPPHLVANNPVLAYYNERMQKDPSVSKRMPLEVWQEHIEQLIAVNIATAPCPRVGEQAVPRTGQEAATMASSALGGVETLATRSPDPEMVYFVPVAYRYRSKGTWIGVTAFGVQTEVESREAMVTGIAVAQGYSGNPKASGPVDKIMRSLNFAAATAQSIVSRTPSTYNLDAQHLLWVSGEPTGSSFESTQHLRATLQAPAEARYIYHADNVIVLRCAAIVSADGRVVERLY
ncbi:MAG: hypothetical protein U1E23_14885 [Reyranellaceae bacterium]